MGFFSKTIPKRKWVDVSATLHNNMKRLRASWFKDFTDNVFPLAIGLRSRVLTQQIEDNLGILQFAVAATTVRENGYVKLKDFDFYTSPLARARWNPLGRKRVIVGLRRIWIFRVPPRATGL
jgi:hypothetical protein